MSRRRRKSKPRWRHLWPMHLPTSRLNSSGAYGHEASSVSPAGGQGSGAVAKPQPGPSGGGHRTVCPNRLWRHKMLAGEGRQLRLRVGDWRVRFVYEKPDIIRILHIRNRRDAYRSEEHTSELQSPMYL